MLLSARRLRGAEMLAAIDQVPQPGDVPLLRASASASISAMVAGNIGRRGARNMTVIGDTVNFAARLEARSTRIQFAVLISSAVREALARRSDVRPAVRSWPRLRAAVTWWVNWDRG